MQKTPVHFKGRELSFPCYHLFSQCTHMHCLSRYCCRHSRISRPPARCFLQMPVTIPCTITGAPVSSYPHPPRRACFRGKLQEVFMNAVFRASHHPAAFCGIPAVTTCSFHRLSISVFYVKKSCLSSVLSCFSYPFCGSIRRKYAIQFPPITFFTSSAGIPRCRSAAVSSGTWLWSVRQSWRSPAKTYLGSASP